MPSLNYRPEIDGLRAIAVISVILFHLGLAVPGGFVGVDIFFVISGYLISSILFREFKLNNFSFFSFLKRRFLRIVPVLSAVVFVTLVAGWWILLPSNLLDLGKSALAQIAMCSNIYFWRGHNYFGLESLSKPLLHTWSLAVEEQFYLFFPLALVVLFKVRFQKGWLVFLFLVFGTLGSLILSVYLLSLKPQATFYLLPTRAWELGIGSIAAALPATFLPARKFVREFLSWTALVALIIPILFYSEKTPFPGMAAVPPCVGAVLFILSNSFANGLDPHHRLTVVGRIFASRPFVIVGLLSYSLYLWHWPVIVYWNYWKTESVSFSGIELAGIILLVISLSVLSWKFVECPFRANSFHISKRWLYSFPSLTLAASVALSIGYVYSKGDLGRFSPEVVILDKAQNDFQPVQQPTAGEVDTDRVPKIGFVSKDATKGIDVLLWGDSHAMAAVPAVSRFCEERKLSASYLTHAGTPPFFTADFPREESVSYTKEEQIRFGESLIRFLKRNPVKYVFLIANWERYEAGNVDNFEKGMAELIEKLNQLGSRVFIIKNLPTYQVNVPKQLARDAIFGNSVSWKTSITDHKARNSMMEACSSTLTDATFIDPAKLLENPVLGNYDVVIDGRPIYRDSNHLTEDAAKKILIPLLNSLNIN